MDTLVTLLRHAAEDHGDRPALTEQARLRLATWSYRRLWETANAIAAHLRHDRGLAPGSRVILWEPNSPRVVATMFGTMAARLILVPIDPTATPEFVSRVAAKTGARLVVSSDPRAPAGAVGVDELPGEPTSAPDWDLPLPDDVAEIVFTSGTTGRPKGVVLTHRNIVSNVEGAIGMIPPQAMRCLSLLPLSHMLEQTVGLYGPLALGSSIHYPGTRRAPAVLKAMRRTKATTMVVVPLILEVMFKGIEEAALSQAPRRWKAAQWLAARMPMPARRILFGRVHRRLGGHLTHLMCGGASLDAKLHEAWERMGVRVIQGYGTTECAPIVAGDSHWERNAGAVGRPLPGVEVSLSPGGEILVKGPNVFAGYWKDDEATGRAFDAEGWYHTGDLGSWRDDGLLTISGRVSERIVLASGMNVYPEDIEAELRLEPEIEDCVVVGPTDEAGHVRLQALVIPATDERGRKLGLPTVDAAVRRVSLRLAPHQRVASCSLWAGSEFPRTNLLKVKRHEVLASLQADEPAAAPVSPDEGEDLLAGLIARVAGIDRGLIQESSDLTLDLGLDSLAMLELAVTLEDKLGVFIEDGELAEMHTVGALRLVVAGGEPPVAGEPATEWSWPGAGSAPVRSALQQLLMFPLHRLVAKPFVTKGRGNLPDGPCLLIANHCSHMDTPSILRALPARTRRRTAVAAAADYWFRSRFLGAGATVLLGAFPFSREGRVRASFERCGELADAGASILIYPEGTRSTTGRMAAFRGGIGLLATQLGLPIVPVGVTGTYAVLPKGRRRPRPGPITVTFGAPTVIDPTDDPLRIVDMLQHRVADLVDPASILGTLPASA